MSNMNQIKLTIKGMHCNSCVALIAMELEEAGFGENFIDIGLNKDSEGGYLILQGIDNTQLEEVIEVVNSMEQYSVNTPEIA